MTSTRVVVIDLEITCHIDLPWHCGSDSSSFTMCLTCKSIQSTLHFAPRFAISWLTHGGLNCLMIIITGIRRQWTCHLLMCVLLVELKKIGISYVRFSWSHHVILSNSRWFFFLTIIHSLLYVNIYTHCDICVRIKTIPVYTQCCISYLSLHFTSLYYKCISVTRCRLIFIARHCAAARYWYCNSVC